MNSISYQAELLAENLPGILKDRQITPGELDVLARLPLGLTERLIANDPSAFPCPRQWARIQAALDVTPQQLLAEPEL